MGRNDLHATICGDIIRLKREQWRGREAQISNYPGLFEEVKKYTWTYVDNGHPYLYSNKLKMHLHKFVLMQLYGETNLSKMLSAGNIIEHLDNDGLNCSYDNLHVLSADYNKAKAFTIDKVEGDPVIPAYVTDVYYSHKNSRYQMQIFFNKDIYRSIQDNIPIESFRCLYPNFVNLFWDWHYVLESHESEYFDITKFHASQIIETKRPILVLTEEEKDHVIIERDGKYYLRLETEDPHRMAVINHTAFQEIDD